MQGQRPCSPQRRASPYGRENHLRSSAPSAGNNLKFEVCNPATTDELWAEVEAECRRVAGTYRLEDINKRPAIQATRQAYKAFGKDPNRYRPSAEALCRRAVKGLPLYRISALVDIINIVSMRSGFSIGGVALSGRAVKPMLRRNTFFLKNARSEAARQHAAENKGAGPAAAPRHSAAARTARGAFPLVRGRLTSALHGRTKRAQAGSAP